MEQEFQPGTQAIDRGAQLLRAVLEAARPVALADLAADVGVPKSTASRLLAALGRQGLVEQVGNRGPFRAGPALVRFATRALADRALVELAEQPMAELGAATGETVNLAIAGADGVEHVSQVDSRHFLGAGQWVGRHVPYHCSATGKILMAYGAADVPAGELPKLTPTTIVDHDALDAELARVRRAGFATAVDELETGLTALAAPVRGDGSQVIAALSMSGPTLRLSPKRVADLRPMVIQHARALSERLAHHEQGVDAA